MSISELLNKVFANCERRQKQLDVVNEMIGEYEYLAEKCRTIINGDYSEPTKAIFRARLEAYEGFIAKLREGIL